ncbi:MAG: rRNA maturation RNase YbeY [Clostridia bacterium]|nr:rRNA maturation RNase YbeY [Clostridia bacterium]
MAQRIAAKVYFSNRQKKVAISRSDYAVLRRAIKEVMRYEGLTFPFEVSVSFVDNEQIHVLNREYRNVDRPTDVLSFPQVEWADPSDREMSLIPGVETVLGDIVISLEKAQEQAEQLGHSFLHEVTFLTIHSMLHLLGYDHERSPEDDEDMCRRQREIISNLPV